MLNDLRDKLSDRFQGSDAKWDFYNDLMTLCATTEIKGTDLNTVYALLVAAARERGICAWRPSAFTKIVGTANDSVEILMHMTGNGYCVIWTTIYCTKCDQAVVSVPLDDMRDWVLGDHWCPYCRNHLVDKTFIYVFDMEKIPWEIDIPFIPRIVYKPGEKNEHGFFSRLSKARGDR